jgi:hypothetical protein
MPTDHEALVEELCNALGKFVMGFSGLQHDMESATTSTLMGMGGGLADMWASPAPMALIQAAFQNRTAMQIMETFFSVFHERWKEKLSEDELKLLRQLQKEIKELVEDRNRILHDAWVTSHSADGPTDIGLFRVRVHGKGVEWTHKSMRPADLLAHAADAKRLGSIVTTCVFHLRKEMEGPTLTNRIAIVDGKVQRYDDQAPPERG